jgi:hypothetical protein
MAPSTLDNFNEDRRLTAQINLYYDLQVPPSTPAPLLIALHGYGANKRQMMREARQLVPDHFAIASLQGPHQHLRDPKEPGGPLRFGFGWLTNFKSEESVAVHHRIVLDLIDTLIAEALPILHISFCLVSHNRAHSITASPSHTRSPARHYWNLRWNTGRLGYERIVQTDNGIYLPSGRNPR